MAIGPYLAMTAADFYKNPHIHFPLACMTPLDCAAWTELPDGLAMGSLLVLTDQLPIHADAVSLLCGTLSEIIFRFGCQGVVLDFQHPGQEEALAFARQLVDSLPCPVAVSDLYARDLECPVFLSPVPPDCRLSQHIAPWQDREIWLDLSTEGMEIVLTEDGSAFKPLPHFVPNTPGHQETNLHIHYAVTVDKASADFTLWRTKADLQTLLQEAEHLEVAKVIGLYQELDGIL